MAILVDASPMIRHGLLTRCPYTLRIREFEILTCQENALKKVAQVFYYSIGFFSLIRPFFDFEKEEDLMSNFARFLKKSYPSFRFGKSIAQHPEAITMRQQFDYNRFSKMKAGYFYRVVEQMIRHCLAITRLSRFVDCQRIIKKSLPITLFSSVTTDQVTTITGEALEENVITVIHFTMFIDNYLRRQYDELVRLQREEIVVEDIYDPSTVPHRTILAERSREYSFRMVSGSEPEFYHTYILDGNFECIF